MQSPQPSQSLLYYPPYYHDIMPYIAENNELIISETQFQNVFKFENQTARRLYVNKFDLLPDVYFSNYGLVIVLRNGVPVFETKDAPAQNPLAEYSTYPIRQKILFLDPHDTIEVNALLLEPEPSKLTVSYNFDFVDEPNPDFLTSFSIAEKTITSRKTTLFKDDYYEKTLNQPHYAIFDNPNYNNMQIAIESNIGYNPDKIEETQNQAPIDLTKFVQAYRGNNSPVRKVGNINNNGGLVSFEYDEQGPREPSLDDVTKLQLKTPFILNPDPITSVFTYNRDGSKYYVVELIADSANLRISEYDLTEKFNMSANNRTLSAQKTVPTRSMFMESLKGVYWNANGTNLFVFGVESGGASQFLFTWRLRDSYLIDSLTVTNNPLFEWPHDDNFLSLIVPNVDGCLHFLSVENTDDRAILTVRKYSFSPSYSLQSPTLISTDQGFYEFGNTRNIIDAHFSWDGRVLFFLTQLKTGDVTQNQINATTLTTNFMFLTTLRADFTALFEYSKFMLDFPAHNVIAKNANFTINEYFLFTIVTGSGWAFYNEDGSFFHPEDEAGEFIADTTKFDTKNETDESRSYQFSLSSPVDFNLDVNYSHLHSISRNHNFEYKKLRRPLPSYPQLYEVKESITNQFNFTGKRAYTQIRNILRVYGDDKTDFENQTFLFERDNWTGEKITVNLDTNKKYIKFEKIISYQFIVEDYSNTLEQTQQRNSRVRDPLPILVDRFTDVVSFVNDLPAVGSEYLPFRYMMYYNRPLPVSLQEYAPTFLVKQIEEEPRKALFDFDVISRTPLPTPDVQIGIDIKADNDEWHTIISNIGNINAIGKTLIELKQFSLTDTLVLPKGKSVLRASLKSSEKVKLSVIAILS